MPYIDKSLRKKFIELEKLGVKIETEGELNYIITKLCHIFLSKFGMLKYARLNTIIGVLECAKQEFYRIIISPYENNKIKENGDV